MHFTTNLLMLFTLASASLQVRDYPTIQNDVGLLNNASIALAESTFHADKSIEKAGATFAIMNYLGQNFTQATSHLNDSAILTESEASAFLERLRTPLLGNFREALISLVTFKSRYSYGERAISAALGTLSSSVTRYGGAVVTKAPSASKLAALSISSSFSSAASSAVSAFAAN